MQPKNFIGDFFFKHSFVMSGQIFDFRVEIVLLGTIHLRRRHVLGGEWGSPLPMFADARGGRGFRVADVSN